MLGALSTERDPRVLVDMSTSDDAGVLALDDERALIHTIDVITPIVDDPRSFGRIAAANSVSDVYAMGGVPTSAVAFLGVPKELPRSAVAPILEGAQEVLRAADAPLLGGHTVKDKELKLGFAVTGLVHPKRIVANSNARAGQVLVLTKPLGTGVLYQAMKNGVRTDAETEAVVAGMSALNRRAGEVMATHGVRAGTDITGFGLAGHALNVARASGVDLVLRASALPAYPGVLAYLDRGVSPGTTDANLKGYDGDFVREGDVPDARVRLVADPQTSGGMLMCVEPAILDAVLAAVGTAWIVGEVTAVAGARPAVRLRG
ncbi:selenide, water dikinase SelD [Myxococcota bacterium]|nr:selenide, water dikinase SelD [Myxococcota bacterium]